MDLSDTFLSLLSNGSAWTVTAGVCLTFVRLIYKGKLVPESTVAMKDRTIEAERAANAELRAALTAYQATGITTVTLLESIQGQRREEDKR